MLLDIGILNEILKLLLRYIYAYLCSQAKHLMIHNGVFKLF